MIEIIFCLEQPSDGLVTGYYVHRKRGAVDLPVRIWFGAPLDPVTGEELDRSWRWQLTLAGEQIDDWADIWPRCGALPIDKQEHDFLVSRIKWARDNDPDDPFGGVQGKFDLLTVALPFGD